MNNMDKELITLNHRSFLHTILNDKFYFEHFKIYDLSNSEDVTKRLGKLSDKQYRYFLLLLNKKKWFDIKKLLDRYLKHI